MDCYKKLNAELIAEIRAMRNQIAIYRKEINETNAQLIYERCLRVEQKQYFLKILGENYRDMVQKIQGNMDISILTSSNNSDCRNSSNANKILSHNRRSSKEILENLRNSNQWQSTHRRVTISPVLCSTDSPSLEENTNSDLMENADTVPQSPVSHKSQTYRNSSGTIEPKSQDDSNEMEDSSVKTSDEESYENENEAENDNNIPEEENVTHLKTRLSQLNILDSIYEEECDLEEITPRVSLNLMNKGLECTEAKTRNSFHRHSLRDLTNCEKLTVRTSPLDKVVSPNIPSPTCSFKNMSGQNFSCSTPCHSNETFSEMMTEFSQTREQYTTLETHRERPKRSCTPTNLKEQSLRVKLRNESKRSISKSKKKYQ